MSDRLALANAIEDAGIERSKAERVASVIVDLVHDSVATKADVQALGAELRARLVPPVERERFERRWNFIDRVFKVAGWLLMTAAFGVLVQKFPHGSWQREMLGTIVIGLYIAVGSAVLIFYTRLVEPFFPDSKGLSSFKWLLFLLVAIVLGLIGWGIIWAIEVALLTIMSVKALP
jgi:hypothetical protein